MEEMQLPEYPEYATLEDAPTSQPPLADAGDEMEEAWQSMAGQALFDCYND